MTLYLSDVPPELLNGPAVQRRLVDLRWSRVLKVVTRYGPLHGKRHSLPPGQDAIRAISRKGARPRYTPGEDLKPISHVHIEQVEYQLNGDYTFPDLVPVMTPGGRR